MCQWDIWFLYNTTFWEVFLFFGEIRLFAFEPGDFLGARSPMLAWASPQSLCPSPRHANRARIFRAGGSPCWRRPPCKAFVLRHVTPTEPGFSAPAAAHVGVGLPAKPLSFATPRQQGPDFPRQRLFLSPVLHKKLCCI